MEYVPILDWLERDKGAHRPSTLRNTVADIDFEDGVYELTVWPPANEGLGYDDAYINKVKFYSEEEAKVAADTCLFENGFSPPNPAMPEGEIHLRSFKKYRFGTTFRVSSEDNHKVQHGNTIGRIDGDWIRVRRPEKHVSEDNWTYSVRHPDLSEEERKELLTEKVAEFGYTLSKSDILSSGKENTMSDNDSTNPTDEAGLLGSLLEHPTAKLFIESAPECIAMGAAAGCADDMVAFGRTYLFVSFGGADAPKEEQAVIWKVLNHPLFNMLLSIVSPGFVHYVVHTSMGKHLPFSEFLGDASAAAVKGQFVIQSKELTGMALKNFMHPMVQTAYNKMGENAKQIASQLPPEPEEKVKEPAIVEGQEIEAAAK